MTVTPPSEIAARRRQRAKFGAYVALFLAIMSLAAWWVLPRLTTMPADVPVKIEGAARTVLAIVGWFKAFWVAALIVGAGLVVLARAGVLDALLPLLNLALLAAALGVVALCLFSYYATVTSIQFTG